MNVKCINNYKCRGELTISKTYDITNMTFDFYYLLNDHGHHCWYEKKLFKTLSEIRAEKIDKLLEYEN